MCVQMELLNGGIDVLIATPGRLLNHHERGSLNLSNTAALVMDEVDVLAGETHNNNVVGVRAVTVDVSSLADSGFTSGMLMAQALAILVSILMVVFVMVKMTRGGQAKSLGC